MFLWVGLGNPGPSMAHQRHNIGFMAVDRIVGRYGLYPWRKRFSGEWAEGIINGQKIMFLKPMTYMNHSGQSVQKAVSFYHLPLSQLFVFHDELDLKPGRIKVKSGGGAAGHNGLRSIDQMLGGSDYTRVRIGIGHPGEKDRVVSYVLGNFSEQERRDVNVFLDALADEVGFLAIGQIETFMSKVVHKIQEKG